MSYTPWRGGEAREWSSPWQKLKVEVRCTVCRLNCKSVSPEFFWKKDLIVCYEKNVLLPEEDH